MFFGVQNPTVSGIDYLDSMLKSISEKIDPVACPQKLAVLNTHSSENSLSCSLSRCLCGNEVIVLAPPNSFCFPHILLTHHQINTDHPPPGVVARAAHERVPVPEPRGRRVQAVP
jgi:hypothetical protein